MSNRLNSRAPRTQHLVIPNPMLNRHSAWAYLKAEKSYYIDRAHEAMRKDQLRRERFLRIKQGVIIPASRMPPQLMVKDASGKWMPELRIIEAKIGD